MCCRVRLDRDVVVAAGRRHHLADRQAERLREREVALVVRRHRHDGAGAVLDQHVVGDPDLDRLVVDGVDDVAPGEHAGLDLAGVHAVGHRRAGRAAHVRHHLVLAVGAADEVLHQRVLGRQHEEGGAEQRVGTGREDRDVDAEVVLPEDHLGALRAADPVALHGQHALGPRLERLHVVEQAVGVVGDLEEPLLEVLRLDRRAAPLAVPVDDLLVRQHRLVLRAPVDGRRALVRQAAVEQLQEDPLRPVVVLRIGGRQLARPVDRPAHPVHLLADLRDVAADDVAGRLAGADGGVLGRQPERVVAHRVQHQVAVAPLEVRDDVAHRVVRHVPHVEVARRVREHLEHVAVRPPVRLRVGGVRRLEGSLGRPHGLPAGLDRLVVVALGRHDGCSLPGAQQTRRYGRDWRSSSCTSTSADSPPTAVARTVEPSISTL